MLPPFVPFVFGSCVPPGPPPPPPPIAALCGANKECGTEISCDRNVRFELCILTASDSDVKSDGNGASNVSRVIVSEHSL